jgi:hypothetical protein
MDPLGEVHLCPWHNSIELQTIKSHPISISTMEPIGEVPLCTNCEAARLQPLYNEVIDPRNLAFKKGILFWRDEEIENQRRVISDKIVRYREMANAGLYDESPEFIKILWKEASRICTELDLFRVLLNRFERDNRDILNLPLHEGGEIERAKQRYFFCSEEVWADFNEMYQNEERLWSNWISTPVEWGDSDDEDSDWGIVEEPFSWYSEPMEESDLLADLMRQDS